ncbi:unnamed protein product, partial [marine sediment metagenome]
VSEDQSTTLTYTINFKILVPLFNDGFETGILEDLPEDWIIYDTDNDELTWYRSVGEALTDSSSAACYSYTSVPSDDWLISPSIYLREGTKLVFFARVGGTAWPEEISVLVSRSDTLMENFDVVLDSITVTKLAYQKYEYYLTAHDSLSAGDKVHIALKRFSTYAWYVLIDDFWVGVPLEKSATLSDLLVDAVTVSGFHPDTLEYTVEISGGLVPAVTASATNTAVTPTITDATAIPGSTTVEVTSEDATVTITYTINFTAPAGTNFPDMNNEIKIYPVPAFDFITISNLESADVYVYDMLGKLVKVEYNLNSSVTRLNISDLEEGLYLIKIKTSKGIINRKMNIAR